MSNTSSSNKATVPEAKGALNRFKFAVLRTASSKNTVRRKAQVTTVP